MCIRTTIIICTGGVIIFALDFVVNGHIMFEK